MIIKNNFIIACDQAFLTAGSNNLNCIGVFTNINAEQFPLTYRHFALVINFDTDALGMHTLQTVIVDDRDKELLRTQLQINITSTPFQVIANFENLVFPKPGVYELTVSLDDASVGSRSITINPIVKQKTTVV